MDEKPVETTLYSLSGAAPGRDERREDERYVTLFRVGSLIVGGERQLCLIKNISAGGMLIRAYSILSAGTRISIEFKQGQIVEGAVTWVDGNAAGIEFDARIDIVELLSGSADAARPRMPRLEIRCRASVRHESRVYGMVARDISQGGMKAESDGSLAVGSDVVVSLPGLEAIAGVVRWQSNGCCGIAFNRLLALSVLVTWLQDQRGTLSPTGSC